MVSGEFDPELLDEREATAQFAGFVTMVLNDVAANVPTSEPFPVVEFSSAVSALAVESMASNPPQLVSLDEVVLVSQSQPVPVSPQAELDVQDGLSLQVRFADAACSVALVPLSPSSWPVEVPGELVACQRT